MARNASAPRSYHQYCGLARALDVIGDRWALLVVRELLVGPRRFGELQAGLPGIATNLLTERLRQLERDGLLERCLGKEPAEGTSYALTSRGAELRAVIEALIRWSTPLMVSGQGSDAFRPGWLAVAVPALIGARPARPTRVEVETQGHHLVLEAGPAGATLTQGRAGPVDATLTAEPGVVLALASGAVDLQGATRLGAKTKGPRTVFERVFGPSSARHGDRKRTARPGR